MLTTEMPLGGAEKVFYEHIVAFSKYYKVFVCLFSSKNIYTGFRFSNTVFELDDVSFSNPLARWKHRSKRLKQLVAENKIDICISHMEGPNFLNSYTRSRCRKILVAHGSITVNPQKSTINKFLTNKFLIPFLYNRADRLVTVSKALQQEHIAQGVASDKITCINNFFEIEKIREMAKEATVLDPVFAENDVLINVGRLANQKNQRFLIKFIRHLREQGRNEKLVLVGDGILRKDLIEQARCLELRVFVNKEDDFDPYADVFVMGATPNPHRFIAKSKLFVLSSFNEGFPLVLGESLACEVPIVSTDCPTGPRELLTAHGSFSKDIQTYERLDCGNIVRYFTDNEAADLEVWTDAVTDLLDHPSRYAEIKNNCLKKAGQYDQPVILDQWRQLIDRSQT